MEAFEIYFDDLSEEAKAKFLRFENISDASEGNFDNFPIATVYIDEK